jgi:hypothetical protein
MTTTRETGFTSAFNGRGLDGWISPPFGEVAESAGRVEIVLGRRGAVGQGNLAGAVGRGRPERGDEERTDVLRAVVRVLSPMIVACTSSVGWAGNAAPSAAPKARCTGSPSARSDAGQGP